jgi:hypothetical protein
MRHPLRAGIRLGDLARSFAAARRLNRSRRGDQAGFYLVKPPAAAG